MILLEFLEEIPEIILVLNESWKRHSILYFPHPQEILLNFYLQILKDLKVLLNFFLLCRSFLLPVKKEKNTCTVASFPKSLDVKKLRTFQVHKNGIFISKIKFGRFASNNGRLDHLNPFSSQKKTEISGKITQNLCNGIKELLRQWRLRRTISKKRRNPRPKTWTLRTAVS